MKTCKTKKQHKVIKGQPSTQDYKMLSTARQNSLHSIARLSFANEITAKYKNGGCVLPPSGGKPKLQGRIKTAVPQETNCVYSVEAVGAAHHFTMPTCLWRLPITPDFISRWLPACCQESHTASPHKGSWRMVCRGALWLSERQGIMGKVRRDGPWHYNIKIKRINSMEFGIS